MKPLVLGNLSYGMYAIGVKDGSRPNACIANTVMQISKATPSDAALVAVALSKENYSCQCVEQEGIFSISVLSQDTPATVIGALGFVSGRGVDKLGNIRHKVLIEGVPVIKENTCCWFLCKVLEKLDLPGQVVFVAEIIAGSDEAVRLVPPRVLSLEQCLEYLADDELLEVTPQNLRMRKQILDHSVRMRQVMKNRQSGK